MIQIKQGLSYEAVTVVSGNPNTVEFKNENDTITLRYIYSVADTSLTSETAIAHEILFRFEPGYLHGFGENSVIDKLFTSSQPVQDICCNTQLILHEITTAKWKGALLKMFLESKALSLLLCYKKTNVRFDIPDCSSCKFLNRPIEKEKILKAREIILSRISTPPTIQELSLEIGMNQCYLKKGFKEIFSVTVYDFIQEERMNKARMLLTSTNSSVSEIAEIIGFSSISNFSNAFKKFAGVFPSELQSAVTPKN